MRAWVLLLLAGFLGGCANPTTVQEPLSNVPDRAPAEAGRLVPIQVDGFELGVRGATLNTHLQVDRNPGGSIPGIPVTRLSVTLGLVDTL